MTKPARPHLTNAEPVDAAGAADRAKARECIGAAVRNLRMKQDAVAELAGVHPVTLSRWQHDNGTPPPFQRAIFDALATSGASGWVLGRILEKCGVVPALLYALQHKRPEVRETKRTGKESWRGSVYRVTVDGKTFEL